MSSDSTPRTAEEAFRRAYPIGNSGTERSAFMRGWQARGLATLREAEAASPAASGDALREALVNLRAAAVAFRGKRAYMDGDPTEQQLTDALIASGHALAASPPLPEGLGLTATFHATDATDHLNDAPPLPEGLDEELTTEKRVRQQIVARLRREYPGAIAQIEAAVVDTELLEAVEDVLTSDSLDPDDHLHWSHLRRIVQDRRARLASREGTE